MPEHGADTNSQSSDSKQPIETSSISQNPTFIIAKVRYFIDFIKILMNNLFLIVYSRKGFVGAEGHAEHTERIASMTSKNSSMPAT